MKKAKENDNFARSDLSKLKGRVRGKYYRQATAGTNLVLIEPDPHGCFSRYGVSESRA